MLFNVPDNKVIVNKLDKRITSIQIPWVEDRMNAWKKQHGYI
jgi:hypothetical protein